MFLLSQELTFTSPVPYTPYSPSFHISFDFLYPLNLRVFSLKPEIYTDTQLLNPLWQIAPSLAVIRPISLAERAVIRAVPTLNEPIANSVVNYVGVAVLHFTPPSLDISHLLIVSKASCILAALPL